MRTTPNTPSFLNHAYLGVIHPVLSGLNYRGIGNRLRDLRRMERMSPAQIRDQQWQGISRLLQLAFESTPFYRQRLNELNVTPADIRSFDDFQKLPVLTREDIRQNQDGLWSRRYSRDSLLSAATGGTTDTPIPLLRSQDCLRARTAVQTYLDGWAGMWPGDKIFRLWGAQQDFAQNPSWRWRVFDRFILRQVWAPTSLLNPETLDRYRQLLNEFRPTVIYAYPTPLAIFCEHLAGCGKPYHRPKTAICTAEPLQEHQRDLIEGTLGCKVFEHYGSRDFGMVGGECEAHAGMHLHPAAVYVECLRIPGAEEDGLHEVFITDLLNDGMPMIRYRINDCVIAASAPCPCGRPFPLIKKIIGRTTDNFYMANGDVVPGVALTNRVIQVCPGLKKMQVIQKTERDFLIRYVPGDGFAESDLQFLRSKLRSFLPYPIQWTFEQVPEIARERSGKTRFCISYVKNQARVPANERTLT